jgi:hypothetical protein
MSSDNETIAMRILDTLAALPATERCQEKLASHMVDEMDLIGANLNEEVLEIVTRAVFARNLQTSAINEVFAARIVEEVAALHPVERYEEKLACRLAKTVHYLGGEYNGDEIIQLVSQGLADRNLIEPEYVPMTQQEEALEDWTVPDLSERRAIWRNFPVVVKPYALGCADGKDRYDIIWHQDNLETWRNERSESYDEWMDYEDWVQWRMDKAFAQYSDIYTVEEGTDPNVIYRIAVAAEEHEAPKQRALDVLRERGVTWKRDGAIHDVRQPAGMSAESCSALVVLLNDCSDCVVLPRTGFVCRLIIAADKTAAAAIAAEIADAAAVPTEGLFDVLMRFPVTWKQSGAVHDVQIHFGRCPRKDIPTMTANLLAVLRSRSDCRVERPVSDKFICRVIKQ